MNVIEIRESSELMKRYSVTKLGETPFVSDTEAFF